ncbi:hypothetical protein C5952_17500 [Cronobacter sakazakii]|uniref:hypothetical protein n=1 Tax=Cronobacter TaxID=413496 RepID=UPI000A10FFA4|nr:MULTISPECIES: hypothetical protein [Cronobacter]ELY2773091.1 hypothetical protein [Cronobacter sakazakii]ELY6202317.1 hypothetical protein [Cronobacter malonaticus]ELY6256192.1 hypothetical protein [Cronobacter malonaticus]ELY6360325.1 hypothetical protein [Cronobacter sakazakii]NCG99794.1 hypothetical protein [Cronobacter malonaticus]
MKNPSQTENEWCDLVRRSDGRVIHSIVLSKRHLLYCVNGVMSVRPLTDDEEVFTPNGFIRFIRRLGYQVTSPSDNI